ncbi:MAG: hypothetical protein KC505_09090 [Myxococcales bacterium]|nr:hypothetical protein [Myxococcales bacterium]
MPRLENGQYNKTTFKKRRAWINQDTSDIKPVATAAEIKTETKQKDNIRKSQENHESNKTATITKHEHNLTKTKLEQDISKFEEGEYAHNININQDYNNIKTILQHNENKIASVLEQTKNNIPTLESYDNFVLFINHVKENLDIIDFDELEHTIVCLSDVQRKVFWLVAFQCLKRNSFRTGPIQIKSFFEPTRIAITVVRTSLDRLVEKGILKRERGKLGKNGFAVISLSKTIFDFASNLVKNYNHKNSHTTE